MLLEAIVAKLTEFRDDIIKLSERLLKTEQALQAEAFLHWDNVETERIYFINTFHLRRIRYNSCRAVKMMLFERLG